MALTAQDKVDIAKIVATVLREKEEQGHACGLCKDNPEAAKEMAHVMGMIKDIGDGDIATGVEKLRSNSKFIIALREGVKTTRVEILKCGSKFIAYAIGAGLVLLFGSKMWAAIEAAKSAGQ